MRISILIYGVIYKNIYDSAKIIFLKRYFLFQSSFKRLIGNISSNLDRLKHFYQILIDFKFIFMKSAW